MAIKGRAASSGEFSSIKDLGGKSQGSRVAGRTETFLVLFSCFVCSFFPLAARDTRLCVCTETSSPPSASNIMYIRLFCILSQQPFLGFLFTINLDWNFSTARAKLADEGKKSTVVGPSIELAISTGEEMLHQLSYCEPALLRGNPEVEDVSSLTIG